MARKKIVTHVPLSHADAVREAMGRAGAGRFPNYSYCSFSTRGVGRFKPETGAEPHIGKIGKIEAVEEERIEVVCEAELVEKIIAAIKSVHPYEEIPIEVYALEN